MPRPVPFCAAALLAAASTISAQTSHVAVSVESTSAHKLIWILDADGRLASYGSTDLHLWMKSAPVPAAVREHPENISAIGRAGLLLYTELNGQPHLWDLRSASEIPLAAAPITEQYPMQGNKTVVNSTRLQLAFSADGEKLFWFQNRLSILQSENQGDISRTGEFLAWTTGVDGGHPHLILQIPLPLCKCDTGACEETCPEIGAWTRPEGVSDFFYLTQSVAGQLSEDDLETTLYRQETTSWSANKLRAPVSGFLDARDNGQAFIGTVPDAACCGWENESDDQTYLMQNGRQATLFDEFSRFHNRDYDVSFFTSNARFSPAADKIAYTITATSAAGQTIRLADQGKDNQQELRQIRDAISNLPQLEVISSRPPYSLLYRLAKAQLIGWLDDDHLLVWQRRQLVSVRPSNGQLTPTGLNAAKPADVFLQ